MAQISDATLKQAVANALSIAVADLNAKWTGIVTDANNSAYLDIRSRLMQRGFTLAQVDAWDRSAEFNTDIGLFWCLTHGGGLNGYDDRNVNKLDRRKELDTVQVTIAGVLTSPGSTADRQVGYGAMSRSDDRFSMDSNW